MESEILRWLDVDDQGNITETVLGENVIYRATTTEQYKQFHDGLWRRFLIDHTLEFYQEDGIWQVDKICYVVG